MNKLIHAPLHLFLSALTMLGFQVGLYAQQSPVVEVHESVRFDRSPPLKGVALRLAAARRREIDRPRLNPNRQKRLFLAAQALRIQRFRRSLGLQYQLSLIRSKA